MEFPLLLALHALQEFEAPDAAPLATWVTVWGFPPTAAKYVSILTGMGRHSKFQAGRAKIILSSHPNLNVKFVCQDTGNRTQDK